MQLPSMAVKNQKQGWEGRDLPILLPAVLTPDKRPKDNVQKPLKRKFLLNLT